MSRDMDHFIFVPNLSSRVASWTRKYFCRSQLTPRDLLIIRATVVPVNIIITSCLFCSKVVLQKTVAFLCSKRCLKQVKTQRTPSSLAPGHLFLFLFPPSILLLLPGCIW